jgi:hypothetical protein
LLFIFEIGLFVSLIVSKFEHIERKKENLEIEEKGVGNDRCNMRAEDQA